MYHGLTVEQGDSIHLQLRKQQIYMYVFLNIGYYWYGKQLLYKSRSEISIIVLKSVYKITICQTFNKKIWNH